MLYLDIPTSADLTDLAGARNDISVSIFLPTTPISIETDADRILLKNLAKEAIGQLEAAGADKRRVGALAEELDDLVDDDEFWRFQAHGLAIYATPDNLRSFRVPNALVPMVEVSDRFHLKPLLRSITFCNVGFVLALAEGGVRLVEVSADLPASEVKRGRATQGRRLLGGQGKHRRPFAQRPAGGGRGARRSCSGNTHARSTAPCARCSPAATSHWSWPPSSLWVPSIARSILTRTWPLRGSRAIRSGRPMRSWQPPRAWYWMSFIADRSPSGPRSSPARQ